MVLKDLGILKTRRSRDGRHLLAKPVPSLLPTSHDRLIRRKLRVVNYNNLLNLQYVPNSHFLGSNSAKTPNFFDRAIDILAITATWLHCRGDDVVIGELCPSGSSFLHNPRSSGHGGGVGLLYKNVLNVKSRPTNPSFKHFE